MKKLWEFPTESYIGLLEASLGNCGKVIGRTAGKFGAIFTFDQGEHVSPRYIVAKTPKIDPKDDPAKIRQRIKDLIYEVNETYCYSKHPLILRFVGLHVCAGAPFVLSVKRDRTLRDLIEAGPATLTEAVSIAIQIAHALEYCQGRGLSAHQDIKPENVLVDPFSIHNVSANYPLRWLIKICDFGLANAFAEFGKFTGSRPYMAPEQYGSPTSLAKADVFALGVILYELVSGGQHPIGEMTHDVWPTALPEKPNKWKHEDVWKKWAKKDPKRLPTNAVTDSQVANDILACLKADVAQRHTLTSLKHNLLQWMQSNDDYAFANLSVLLTYFDKVVHDEEIGGWPYYEELLEQINAVEW